MCAFFKNGRADAGYRAQQRSFVIPKLLRWMGGWMNKRIVGIDR